MRCQYGDGEAAYRCARTGEYVCPDHARLDVVSVSSRVQKQSLRVRPASASDYPAIENMAMTYWGETDVDCFGSTYDILSLPAFVAVRDGGVAGVLSYALERERLNIVMLNVRPEYQGRGAARSLLALAEEEAHKRGLSCLVVATTNDDLPALCLYQRSGFVITQVKPGAVLAHHGRQEAGFAGIPVRDEIQLEKRLAQRLRGS